MLTHLVAACTLQLVVEDRPVLAKAQFALPAEVGGQAAEAAPRQAMGTASRRVDEARVPAETATNGVDLHGSTRTSGANPHEKPGTDSGIEAIGRVGKVGLHSMQMKGGVGLRGLAMTSMEGAAAHPEMVVAGKGVKVPSLGSDTHP